MVSGISGGEEGALLGEAYRLVNWLGRQLEKEDPEQARIVVLKFFGGLTNLEVAENLGIGERSVDRQWACAKARMFGWIRSHK